MASTQESTKTPAGVQAETWDRFKDALEDLLRQAAPASSSGSGGAQPDDLRKMVTEAVSAVLLESELLEKLVQRTLIQQLKAEGGVSEDIRQLCLETLRTFSMQTFGPLMKSEIKEIVQNRLTEFSNTEEFKAALDARFRVLEKYLRSDVIPSEVNRHLEATS